MEHAALLAERRRHHIFVDQLHPASFVAGYPPYLGGLGKSGLEAMAAGCVVITTGGPFACRPHFDNPPVTWILPRGLRPAIETYVNNPWAIGELGQRAAAWAATYCTPADVAGRIMERIA